MPRVDSGMVTSALELPGYRIVRNFGIVRGIIVRSRSVIGNLGAALQTMVGGNITILTNLCEKTGEDAFELLLQHAGEHGANAVIGMRYDATEMMQSVTEVLAHGTAVHVELISSAFRGRPRTNGKIPFSHVLPKMRHRFPRAEGSAPRVEKRSIGTPAQLCSGMKLASRVQPLHLRSQSREKFRHHLFPCELQGRPQAAIQFQAQTPSATAALHQARSLRSAIALWHWRAAAEWVRCTALKI